MVLLVVRCPKCDAQHASDSGRKSPCPVCGYFAGEFTRGDPVASVVPLAERRWLPVAREEDDEEEGPSLALKMCPQCFAKVEFGRAKCPTCEYVEPNAAPLVKVDASPLEPIRSPAMSRQAAAPARRSGGGWITFGLILIALGVIVAFPLQVIALGLVLAFLGAAFLLGAATRR